MPEPVQRLLVDIREAALMLSIGQRSVERLLEEGTLRSVRVTPRTVRIRVTDIERFIADQEARAE